MADKVVGQIHIDRASVNLEELISRASIQEGAVERERLASGTRALANQVGTAA
jgi:hypothetical protein